MRWTREGRKTAAKAKDFPQFKSKRDRDFSVYLPGSALKPIRRQAADVGKARGWVELPGMDDTQVCTRVKRNGQVEEKRVKLRRAIRVRGGRWPEADIRSATIKREGGAWFLSVQFDGPPPKKVKREHAPVAMDKPVHPDLTAYNGPAVDPDAGPEIAAVSYDAGLKDLLIGSDRRWQPYASRPEPPEGREEAAPPAGNDGPRLGGRSAVWRWRNERGASSRSRRASARRTPVWPRRIVRSGVGGPICCTRRATVRQPTCNRWPKAI